MVEDSNSWRPAIFPKVYSGHIGNRLGIWRSIRLSYGRLHDGVFSKNVMKTHRQIFYCSAWPVPWGKECFLHWHNALAITSEIDFFWPVVICSNAWVLIKCAVLWQVCVGSPYIPHCHLGQCSCVTRCKFVVPDNQVFAHSLNLILLLADFAY